MKKFSELGINIIDNHKVFQVPQISITEILNCEIEVLEFELGVKTQHGDDRCIVRIRHEGIECKFFTSSSKIKETLQLIPKECFPFSTTIKVQKYGTGNSKTYYFT